MQTLGYCLRQGFANVPQSQGFQLSAQRLQLRNNRLPNYLLANFIVTVDQNIPQSNNFAPTDFWMGLSQFIGQPASGFPQDF
jgi:hypothetical protein